MTDTALAFEQADERHSRSDAADRAYRVGIVGFGRIGRRRATIVSAHPRLRLVGVADPRIDDATELPPSVARHRSGADLLQQDLDAVFVCTPNAVTTDLVVGALESGKHVFAEKPPGCSVADIERMRAVEARFPELRVKFGFNHREHDSVRLSQSIVASGELGRLMWLRGIYGKAGGPGYQSDWRADACLAGGGILLDQGIHMLDLFRLFAGDFDEVRSFVGQTFWKVGLEDNAFALLRNASGCVAMLHSSATHWNHTFRLEMYLTEGYLALDGFLTGSQTYGREMLVIGRRDWRDINSAQGRPREERYYFDDDRSWEREVDDFVRCIATGSQVRNGNSLDARRAMDLVARIYAADGWNSAV